MGHPSPLTEAKLGICLYCKKERCGTTLSESLMYHNSFTFINQGIASLNSGIKNFWGRF